MEALAGVLRAMSWDVSCYIVIVVHTSLFVFFAIKHLNQKATGIRIFLLLTMGDYCKHWHKPLTAHLKCLFEMEGRPCYLIFAIRTTKLFRVWDGLFGQLVPLFLNCLKTENQMDLVSAKETFGTLWQWKFVVIQSKPYEDKCSSLTKRMWCVAGIFFFWYVFN